jgi:N-ethylmaleimide reductase
MFLQLMHCGRIAHPLNLPAGGRVLAPSAIAAAGEMYTDAEGPQAHPVPEAMTQADIKTAIAEFVSAAKNAVQAGFDGVELHAANGYLLEQFIRPSSNQRNDEYGGSSENRARFVLEVADAVIAAIGKDKVGMRLSPYGVFNDMPPYAGTHEDYCYLAEQLDQRGLVYLHLVDHAAMGAPEVPDAIKQAIRNRFKRSLILSGGYDANRAESDLSAGKCDLVAFGRPLLANPDLLQRWENQASLNAPDMSTFYTPGAKGYTDYPVLSLAHSAE